MSFYFYDLETSGLDAKWARIMQFAGVRTDDEFNIIGQPDNWLVKLTPEILPDPYAILVTGITPQKTLEEGLTEAEFLEKVQASAFKRGTTMLGFNSVRFDDEFMRYTLYRNFHDPYEREWSDDRSRWDIIDLVRMTRALRPEGIKWPFDDEGKPTNRLELLSIENDLEHNHAHDALSDVYATIEITKLVKEKQPKLFEHLLSIKGKKQVAAFLESNKGKPIVHTSGMYGSDHLATSAVSVLGPHPTNPNAVLVYDLRHSPNEFKDLSVEEIARLAFTPYKQLEEGERRLPVKAIHLNKSPALAPIGVLSEESQERIGLTLTQIKTHQRELSDVGDFRDKVTAAWESSKFDEIPDVDTQLYSGFLSDSDRAFAQQVRNKSPEQLADFHPNFTDERMQELLLRYKGRNFPQSLSQDEQAQWEQFRAARLTDAVFAPINMTKYLNKLQMLATEVKEKEKLFLLEELQLYAESIAPYENEELL